MSHQDHTDPDTLKIPAYLRNKAIVTNSRQRLLWTAWDRKEAGAPPNSKRKTGRVKARPKFQNTAIATSEKNQPQEYFPQSITELDALHTRARLQARPRENPKQLFPSKPKKYKPVGEVTHYLDKINVAIIKLNAAIKLNDILLIEGSGFIYTQPISEIQIDKKPVEKAGKGDHIGLKVSYPATLQGSVYKVM